MGETVGGLALRLTRKCELAKPRQLHAVDDLCAAHRDNLRDCAQPVNSLRCSSVILSTARLIVVRPFESATVTTGTAF